jgi:hypothetical protein
MSAMKERKVGFVERDEMILDEAGRDYTPVETDEDPKEVLSAVNWRLREFGLEIVLGNDGVGDYVYFRVDRIERK